MQTGGGQRLQVGLVVRESGEKLLDGSGLSFWSDGNVLELNRS